uniref:Uncharacterized protein n=1 Tax=Plectus sambesii TaxID=2011161 RepID=A0A914V9N0_9BILA
MRLLAVIVGLGVLAATQAATDLAAICAKAADAPKSEDGKDVYTHLCQLQLELVEVKDVIHEMLSDRESAAEEMESAIPEEVEAPSADKRKNEFIRFGKRKNEFIRFGKRKNEFIRFGKRKNEFIRFGRSAANEEPMEKDEMTKRKNEFIRFGKRKNEFIRFG